MESRLNLPQLRLDHPSGRVEYLVAGEGPPVLSFHGTGVSNKVVLDIEYRLIDEGFQVIIPHRPGYYGTPRLDRTTPQQAADLCAAILDNIGLQRVAVVGTSGGGPAAICFAQAFPEKTKCLVLQCAMTHCWNAACWMPAPDRWAFPLLRQSWIRKSIFPVYRHLARKNSRDRERWLPRLSGERYSEVKDDPGTLALANILMQASLDSLEQPAGMFNDIDVFCRTPWTQLEKLTCPIQLLHDPCDGFVPFVHSSWLAEQLPHAELHELHCAGHLLWSGQDVQLFGDLRRDFLHRYN